MKMTLSHMFTVKRLRASTLVHRNTHFPILSCWDPALQAQAVNCQPKDHTPHALMHKHIPCTSSHKNTHTHSHTKDFSHSWKTTSWGLRDCGRVLTKTIWPCNPATQLKSNSDADNEEWSSSLNCLISISHSCSHINSFIYYIIYLYKPNYLITAIRGVIVTQTWERCESRFHFCVHAIPKYAIRCGEIKASTIWDLNVSYIHLNRRDTQSNTIVL